MSNKAVITATKAHSVKQSSDVGVYLHWNGGRDSVEAFLAYCKLAGHRPPSQDCYGWARLCQVIGNYFGGSLCIGIDQCRKLDCDNYDNGVYVIDGWDIVKRSYFHGKEQDEYELLDMLRDINQSQPESERLEDDILVDYVRRAKENGEK